jgi:hypothetical protein
MESTYVNTLMPNKLVPLLDQLAEDADSNRSAQIREGILMLAAVRHLHRGTQATLAKEDEELAEIHARLVSEFGEAGMLNKKLEWVTFAEGGRGLRVDGEYVFVIHPDDPAVLCCQVGEGEDLEQYQVRGGGLVKVGPVPFAEPSMN